MYRLFFIVIALIAYGSLYPWDFHSVHLAASPIWLLFHSWPTAYDRFEIRDTVVNLSIYVPFGMLGLLAFRQNVRPAVAILIVALLAFLLSGTLEILQLFDATRVCSTADLICNVSGVMLGIGIASVHQQWLKRFHARVEAITISDQSGAWLLLFIWLGYQGFPFVPVLSRTILSVKLHTLFGAATISPLDTFGFFIEWLAVAFLLETVFGSKLGRKFLLLIALALPLKLLIISRTLSPSELAGVVIACTGWYCFLSRYKKRNYVITSLIVSLLILRGLAPYHWSTTSTPFSWIPFRASIEAERYPSFVTLLQKCFLYGSVIWLLKAAVWKRETSAFALALLLSVIEVIQMHLPGRSPEITDPLLVFILAIFLKLLDRA